MYDVEKGWLKVIFLRKKTNIVIKINIDILV